MPWHTVRRPTTGRPTLSSSASLPPPILLRPVCNQQVHAWPVIHTARFPVITIPVLLHPRHASGPAARGNLLAAIMCLVTCPSAGSGYISVRSPSPIVASHLSRKPATPTEIIQFLSDSSCSSPRFRGSLLYQRTVRRLPCLSS